jgi:3-methyladenine DNA glycosylase AlkD
MLNRADSAFVLELAMELINSHNQRWLAYELIRYHKGAFREIGEAELGELGQGMSSWDEVDSFARTLSGPAWMNGQVTDNLIHKWVRSDDLWWRRAALVSTVAWNTISQGGRGDLPRTLAVCRMLLHDREDMVDKAMSWALRELVRFDSDGLCAFMREHDAELSSRVKREVRNKLTTGLKNPKTA